MRKTSTNNTRRRGISAEGRGGKWGEGEGGSEGGGGEREREGMREEVGGGRGRGWGKGEEVKTHTYFSHQFSLLQYQCNAVFIC